MNRINMNIINEQNNKGALIQYFCSECNIGGETFIEFTNIAKVKSKNCEHFDIKFLFSSETYKKKLTCSFNCKNCKNNDMIELFNEKTTNESGSINYKCNKCNRGNITVEYLFLREEINLNDMPYMEKPNIPNEPPKIKNEQKKIVEEKKIILIFEHDGKKYEIKVSEKLTIPAAFHELCKDQTNKNFENLNIKNYINNGNPLSKYKTIKDLKLKDKDIITLELRGYQGWGNPNQ